MEPKLYSRAELAAIAGVPEDAVVFWIRQGLLVSVDREARKHRRFDAREIKMAALLGEARSLGMNVSALRAIAEKVRAALLPYDLIPSEITKGKWAGEFLDAVAGDGESFTGLVRAGHMTEVEADNLTDAAHRVGRLDFRLLNLAWSFDAAGGDVSIYRGEDDEWTVQAGAHSEGGSSGARSLVVFNLDRIFDLPWPAN